MSVCPPPGGGGTYLGWGGGPTSDGGEVPTSDGGGYLPWIWGIRTLDGVKRYLPWIWRKIYLGQGQGVPTLDGEGYLPWTRGGVPTLDGGGVLTLDGEGIPALEGEDLGWGEGYLPWGNPSPHLRDREAEQVIATWRAVCLLSSRRRTFLFLIRIFRFSL